MLIQGVSRHATHTSPPSVARCFSESLRLFVQCVVESTGNFGWRGKISVLFRTVFDPSMH